MIISVHNQLKLGFSDRQKLIDVINKDLCEFDLPKVNDVRTVDRIINTIDKFFNINVERETINRKIHYKYVDPDQQIAKLLLEGSGNGEMVLLYDVLLSLEGLAFNHFTEKIFDVLVDKGFGHLDEIKYFEKNVDRESNDYKNVIQFDSHSRFEIDQGTIFYELFESINGKKTIKIEYRAAFKYDKEVVISPYLLKQYNKRWFLFGYDHEGRIVSNYGLDRIKSISISHEAFNLKDYESFFNEDYFEDIVGVSKNIKNTVQKVKIRINNEQFQYINTKPIHETQTRISEESNDEYQTIVIEVIINFELIALLLSFGSNITIMEPRSLQETMIRIHEKSLENYA